jgi:hypothetical protein
LGSARAGSNPAGVDLFLAVFLSGDHSRIMIVVPVASSSFFCFEHMAHDSILPFDDNLALWKRNVDHIMEVVGTSATFCGIWHIQYVDIAGYVLHVWPCDVRFPGFQKNLTDNVWVRQISWSDPEEFFVIGFRASLYTSIGKA